MFRDNCRNCRSIGAWGQRLSTVFQPPLLLLRLPTGSWRPSMYNVYWHKYLVKYVQYDDCACSVLAAKHPLLFAGVHWTSLAAGRTTSSTWLDYLPLAAGVNIGLPLPAGVKQHLHTWHCRGQPLWHWSFPPMDIGFQCWGDNPWFCCALRVGKISSCCCALSIGTEEFALLSKIEFVRQ